MLYHYDDLKVEAQQKAYGEALNYIKDAFKDDKEVMACKEAHAISEARDCAVYHKDGTFGTPI